MSNMSNVIHWYENSALDDPVLNSPQPCPRGIHCDYKITDRDTGALVPACCRFVHPGEEGTGRRLFPARMVKDTGPDGCGKYDQPACVRLTGASQGFYERRRLKLAWSQWCDINDIPFSPALPGQPFTPLTRIPFVTKTNSKPLSVEMLLSDDMLAPFKLAETPKPSNPPTKNTKNKRKRANKKARIAMEDAHYNNEAWCSRCHVDSNCDGDHGDEMRDGFFIIKGPPLIHREPLPSSMAGGTLGATTTIPSSMPDEEDCDDALERLIAESKAIRLAPTSAFASLDEDDDDVEIDFEGLD